MRFIGFVGEDALLAARDAVAHIVFPRRSGEDIHIYFGASKMDLLGFGVILVQVPRGGAAISEEKETNLRKRNRGDLRSCRLTDVFRNNQIPLPPTISTSRD